ncbi:MAG: DUF4423 domain-containing protein [Proteobacteria bacterium]|nr:MAG: DUF4423 domain-containing protein [Pseudomonadota bacterium]
MENLLSKMETEGLLSRTGGEWRDLLDDAASVAPDAITGAVVRRILKDMMAASSAAVDQVPFDDREHSFALFPVATRQLPLLKKKLNSLQREFGALAAKSKFVKNEIYAFHLGFFPVTKELKR